MGGGGGGGRRIFRTAPFVGWSLTECLGLAGVGQAGLPGSPRLSFYKRGGCAGPEGKGYFWGAGTEGEPLWGGR